MAQQGVLAAAEHCGDALTMSRDRGVADRVNAVVCGMKPAAVDQPCYRVARIPQPRELVVRYDSELSARELGNRPLTSCFVAHVRN